MTANTTSIHFFICMKLYLYKQSLNKNTVFSRKKYESNLNKMQQEIKLWNTYSMPYYVAMTKISSLYY